MAIKDNLNRVNERIAAACAKVGRSAGEVKLVAVSKYHTAEEVQQAYDAGVRVFGENRVQEALQKFKPFLPTHTDSELHIIGHLQRNKVGHAIEIAKVIESIDSTSLLEEVEKKCAAAQKNIAVLLELHTGEESKTGFADIDGMRQALELATKGNFPHVAIKGLMTMAPNCDDEAVIRKSFIVLREAKEQLLSEYPVSLSELSMGMSSDFAIAIEEGATIVRIGTAIFGEHTVS